MIVEGIPRALASNVATTMFGFSFDLADEPTTPCGEGCEPPSGEYALVSSLGGTVIPPDGSLVPFAGGDYVAANEGSGRDGLDTACAEVVRWYVLPGGG
jgi:hypothetical protein